MPEHLKLAALDLAQKHTSNVKDMLSGAKDVYDWLLSRSKFDLESHLHRQRDWSEKTFGPGPRTFGVTAHIRKELEEIERAPDDVEEWIDVVILGFDGALRTGTPPDVIIKMLEAKQTKNEGRDWPDWRTMSQNDPIEHKRDGEKYGA